MLYRTIVAAALLVALGSAVSLPSTSHVLHEKRASAPAGWIKRSEAPQDAKLPVRIELTPQNAELGHSHLMAMSDPASPDFGKHWSPKEVQNFFSPSNEAVTAVREWLVSSGVHAHRHQVASSRNHVRFEATVQELESLLKTDYAIWEHAETTSVSISSDEYYVPHHIKHYIDFITPTIGLSPHHESRKRRKRDGRFGPLIKAAGPEAANLTDCWEIVSPECIRGLYGVPEPSTAVEGNEMGIFESGDVYDQESLNLFFSNAAPNIPNNTHPILQSIDGGTAPTSTDDGGGESALDLDLAYPLIYPQQIKLYQTLDVNTAESTLGIFDPFLDALDASYCIYDGGDDPNYDPHLNGTEQCGVYNPPNVVSLSYEIAEAYYSRAYEVRQCHEYMKLGMMGTSIIFASGDNGTLSRAGFYGCLAGGAQNPSAPSTCPYVTSVGGTQIQPNAPVTAPEVAVNPSNNPFAFAFWPSFSSGGGFSNVFPRPSYQDSAVSGYLNTAPNLPASNTYNSSGRAFPDVAAVSYNILSFAFGQRNLEEGTSASAPIFASIINRLNEERIIAGKGPVGFLNPILYSNPGMFNDITEGYNLGCNATPAFNATTGWDPVTGLGTPNYPKMREVFMNLP